jgi:peroxiredoxin
MQTTSFTPDTLAELFASMGVGRRAMQSGDAAPDVTVYDATGAPIRLRDRWAIGPLIVVFFRGGWCNYCNLQLHDWQRHLDELQRLDATLVAVSPQGPDGAAEMAEGNGPSFAVLSDPDLKAAEAFGIAFTLPPEIVDYFVEIGTDIPVLNGNGLWALPIPSTYVIDRGGVIRYADVQPDYRKRPRPADALASLEK